MVALGLIIALKCLLAAICISILDFDEKPIKLFWLWVIAVICSLKWLLLTAVAFPLIVWLVYMFAFKVRLKSKRFDNLLNSVNTVLYKKESLVKKIEGIVKQVSDYFKSE